MDTLTKELTFKPLSRNRYRCNQTGQVMTQSQILSYVHDILNGGNGNIVVNHSANSPTKKKPGTKHPSKYRSKKR